MNPLGKCPDEILANRVSNDLKESSWHFFQAKSWLDLAQRTKNPSAVQYAAFELRYGIEYLLFELLVLSTEQVTSETYDKCIGDPQKMGKLIGTHGANYQSLAEFGKIIYGLTQPGLKIQVWDVKNLFRAWGVASSYLHFVGAHRFTHGRSDWIDDALLSHFKRKRPVGCL